MFIDMYVQHKCAGKPLTAAYKFLENHGIIRFRTDVHAAASKAKNEIARDVYKGPRYDAKEMAKLIRKVKNETPPDQPATSIQNIAAADDEGTASSESIFGGASLSENFCDDQ